MYVYGPLETASGMAVNFLALQQFDALFWFASLTHDMYMPFSGITIYSNSTCSIDRVLKFPIRVLWIN